MKNKARSMIAPLLAFSASAPIGIASGPVALTSTTEVTQDYEENVVFSEPYDCNEKTCYNFSVVCEDIAPQEGILHISQNENPRNTIFLLSGYKGLNLYSKSGNFRAQTLEHIVQKNARAVEVQWLRPEGWVKSGEGMVSQLGGFGTVARAFLSKYPVEGNVCAQGNSGGSVQIEYGLVFYESDKFLDTAILTGGALASLTRACNVGNSEASDLSLPKNSSIQRLLDNAMWGENGADYCENSVKSNLQLPEEVIRIFEHESPLDVNLRKKCGPDYSHNNTNVFFINSVSDPTNLHSHARAYYQEIEAKEKAFIEINASAHDVDNTFEGSIKIRELLDKHCLEQ